MGICASCLGLNRNPSQDDVDETDPLLDEPSMSYGAAGADGQVDEEELQREREELDRITNAATENMIDVHQHDAADLPNAGSRSTSQNYDSTQSEDDEEDEEEAAWLESVQADNLASVPGTQAAGGLVLDMGQLRDEPSAAKKSLKAKMGS